MKKFIICFSILFLISCGGMSYEQCRPDKLNTFDYMRCGERNVQSHLQNERQELYALQQNERKLRQQYYANQSQIAYLNASIIQADQALRRSAMEIEMLKQKINYTNLSISEQKALMEQLDQSLAIYESKAEVILAEAQAQGLTVNDVYTIGKFSYNLYDLQKSAKEAKNIRKEISLARTFVKGIKVVFRLFRLFNPVTWAVGIVGEQILDSAINRFLE